MLLLISSDLIGCVCGKASKIEEYDFIALVEVVGIVKSEVYKPGDSKIPEPIFYEIKVRTIDQYQGNKEEYIIILGGNFKYKMGMTSCDMKIEINEEWLIFGNKFKGKIAAHYCNHSRIHKTKSGEIDYKYSNSLNLIKELNFKIKKKEANITTSVVNLKYLNNKIKLEEQYNSIGELNGIRTGYYSNGQVMIKENYKNGNKHGSLQWYHKNGKTHRTSNFKDGKEICETYYYDYKGEIERINFHDDNGNYITTDKK